MALMVPALDLVQIDCYVGGLSGTTLAVGTGQKTLTLSADSPRLVQDMEVTLRRLGDAGVWMRGRVLSRPWDAAVRIQVTASAGAGSHTDWLIAEGSLRFSTGERGYWTAPGDDPAQAFWAGRLRQSLDIRYDLYERGTTYGQSRLEVGEIILIDDRHRLSCLLDYGLSGQAVKVWRLDREDQPFSAATLVMRGRAAAPVMAGDGLAIRVQGRAAEFDRPVQAAQYAGNNVLPAGLEGSATDIKGQRKSLLYGGVARECPLDMVNTSRLILQASTTNVAVLAVSDMGQPLTPGVPYATKAEMESQWPARGQYRVWTGAEGTFIRLGATPAGAVTADLRAQAVAAAQYPGAVMQAIVTGPGGLTTGEVDLAALAALDAACPWPVAIWIEKDETIAQALDRICASVGAWWCFTPQGTFTAGRLALSAPVLRLRRLSHDVMADAQTFDILAGEILALADEEAGAPVHAVRVGYARVLTVQDAPAGSVTADRRAFLAQEYRYTAEASDALTLARNPGARILTLDTDQTGEAGAIALRDQQLALRKGRKRRVAIGTRLSSARLSALRLGQTVSVLDPALGLPTWRDMLILSLAIDGRRGAVTLGLWG